MMTICKVCNIEFEPEIDYKNRGTYKSCKSCRMKITRKPRTKKQKETASTITPDDSIEETIENNKSDVVNILDDIQIIPTQPSFYNIGEYDENKNEEEEESQKPLTINSKLDMIYNSIGVSNNNNIGTNDEQIDLLKSRIDNLELILQKQMKLVEDMERNIQNCLYKIYCKL